jgi:hypothetical protein
LNVGAMLRYLTNRSRLRLGKLDKSTAALQGLFARDSGLRMAGRPGKIFRRELLATARQASC